MITHHTTGDRVTLRSGFSKAAIGNGVIVGICSGETFPTVPIRLDGRTELVAVGWFFGSPTIEPEVRS